jgi:putative hemolysin
VKVQSDAEVEEDYEGNGGGEEVQEGRGRQAVEEGRKGFVRTGRSGDSVVLIWVGKACVEVLLPGRAEGCAGFASQRYPDCAMRQHHDRRRAREGWP